MATSIGADAAYTPHSDATSPDLFELSPEAKASVSVLIIDDDRTLREGCASVLGSQGFNVSVVSRGDEALSLVSRRRFDIIICDLYMTPVSGMDILRGALATSKDSLVIMMTGDPSVTSSVETLRAGAWDYLPKPFSASHLLVLIGRAAHAVMAAREAQSQQSAHMEWSGNGDKVMLFGVSAAFRRVVDLARKIAPTDASVMIFGESGTGKEVIAQFIHAQSRRSRKKMVPINCAALPEPLLESEMFGHRKGAFTGADREKAGLLETANGGTLFLDELTEMSLPLQAKLLRVVQDGVVRRVGSEDEDAVVDVRFISATNRDPQEAVASGVLRADLFYRLRVVPLYLPPLRERPEDIPVLANHFLAMSWKRHRRAGAQMPHLTPEAIEFLRRRAWRGNVRELQNVIEHLAVLAEPHQPILPADIPMSGELAVPGATPTREPAGLSNEILNDGFHVAKDRLVAQFEKEYLHRLVSRAGGNMSRAARLASIDRTTLYRLLEKHSFTRTDLDNGVDVRELR